jgi:hypothetical protein
VQWPRTRPELERIVAECCCRTEKLAKPLPHQG